MLPVSTNETTSTIGDLASIAAAVVGVQETATILARDKHNNLQGASTDVFKVTLTHSSDQTVVVQASVVHSATVYQYFVTYTLTQSGNYTLIAQVQPGGIGPFF